MSVSNNRFNKFEKSETKTRKRHQVVLTSTSPSANGSEMELTVSQVVHTEPSEQAVEAKAQRIREQEVQKAMEEQKANNAVLLAAQAAQEAEAVKESAKSATPVGEPVVYAKETEALVEAAPISEEMPAPATAEESVSFDAGVVESASVVADDSPRAKSRFKLSLTQKKALSGWLFVLPFVIGILFIYGPIVFDSIAISLSDVKLLPSGMQLTWNNFGNYAYLFAEDGDPYFSITIVDGIKDLILQIPAIVIFALFMAIILNQKMTGRAAFRAIFFLPVILSTGIIDAIDTNSAFMNAVNNSQGGVDDNTGAEASSGIISAMDLEQLLGGIKIGTELVDYVVGLVNSIFDIVSRSGVQMLIFLSGLQSISPSIYESCEVEGASAWETFWKITLPMISPMILVNAIYTVIDAFTAADNRVMIYIEKIYSKGGPGYAHSSAMSWIYVGVVLMFIVVVALIMKTVVFYQKRD